MSGKTYSEQDIAALIDRFNDETQTQDTAPQTYRRTRIVEEVTAPESGYRVMVEGFDALDIDATDAGEAVVMAHALAKVTPGMWNYGGALFLWNYSVTDSEGVTLRGEDKAMRGMVERARMRRR